MLKWIQDRYEAEVVCLTVNLGQPGEDYDVIEAQGAPARRASSATSSTRARSSPPSSSPRRSRPTRIYGAGYPLFTALGRPLIAKLAVEYARSSGCDTIAHGCTGKGNDQVRIEATIATLAPGAEGDRAGALLADGPRGGDRLRARARDPASSRAPRWCPTRSTTTSGGAPRRAAGSRTSSTPPRTTCSSSSRAPRRRPTSPSRSSSASSAGVPVALDGERLGLVELIERAAEIGARHGVGIVDHIEDRIVGPEGARHLRGPRGRDPADRPPGARAAGVHDPPEPVQAPARPPVGLPRVRGAVVGAAAQRPRRLHGRGQRPVTRHDRAEALQGPARGSPRAPRRTPSTTPPWPSFSESGGLFSQSASPGFIELFSLQSRMAWRLRAALGDRQPMRRRIACADERHRLPPDRLRRLARPEVVPARAAALAAADRAVGSRPSSLARPPRRRCAG